MDCLHCVVMILLVVYLIAQGHLRSNALYNYREHAEISAAKNL